MRARGWTDVGIPRRRIAVAVLALALPLGVAITLSPSIAAALLAVVLVGAACAFWPRFEILLLAAFLLIQDPLQIAAGADSGLALAIKRADEFLLLAVFAVAIGSPGARATLAHRRVWGWMALCLLPMAIATILRGREWAPVAIDVVLVSKPFLLFAIGASVRLDPQRCEPPVRRLSWVLTATLAVAFVFLLLPELQYRYLGPLDKVEFRMGLRAAQGWFIDTSSFAWLGVAAFAIAWAGYLAYRRPLLLAQAALAATCVLLTWRRKSMLAVAVVLVLPLFVTRVRATRWRVLALVVVAVAILSTLLAPYIGALAQRTVDEYGSVDPYATGRSALYYTSFRIAADRFPLGTGFASFGSHASRMYYSDVYHDYGLSDMYGLSPTSPYYIADTYWPMLLGQGGVFSALAFLGLLAALAWTAMRHVMRSEVDPWLPLATLLLVAGSTIESVASHFYGSSLQAASVFLIAGAYWRTRSEAAAAG